MKQRIDMPNSRSTIFSVDPSSTVVGYVEMNQDGRLMQGGRITPAVRSAGSYARIDSLCGQVRELLEFVKPGIILVEWTKGKVGKRHHGRGAGLAVYGCGVGAVARECAHYSMFWKDCEVIAVLENDWTRGVKKQDRQLAVASEYPAYRIADDPGADVADAIGMTVWWLKQKRLFR